MRKYIIMGIQGSGKGTHAKLLAQDFDLVHIAVGDIFRWNVQNHTKIGAQVRRTMAGGQLVGDDLVEGVVRGRLSEHDWNYGFIIDGFPRNERQAEFFLESYRNAMVLEDAAAGIQAAKAGGMAAIGIAAIPPTPNCWPRPEPTSWSPPSTTSTPPPSPKDG